MAGGTHDELTAHAVDRQLRAMGAERYDIGLIHQVTDRPIPRFYTHEQALRADARATPRATTSTCGRWPTRGRT